MQRRKDCGDTSIKDFSNNAQIQSWKGIYRGSIRARSSRQLKGNSISGTQQSSFRCELKEILTECKQPWKTQTRLTPSMDSKLWHAWKFISLESHWLSIVAGGGKLVFCIDVFPCRFTAPRILNNIHWTFCVCVFFYVFLNEEHNVGRVARWEEAIGRIWERVKMINTCIKL